ncbi:MAG: TonB-dependent receptor, partial [Nitrososphaera sp.]|nr:TonB-dependent receptor [Nitrososphaera sp.]
VQHQYQRGWFNSIVGFGYTDGEFERRDVRSVVPFTAAFGAPRIRIDDDEDSEELNAYVYLPLHPVPNATVILGASYDSFKELGVEKHPINPKFGMIWNPFSTTTLRLAAFRVLKRSFASNQTIEPTQIAGFNQFFDDTNGTESTRYGVGIDQRIGRDIFAGVEASWRKAEVVKFLDPGTSSSIRLVTEDFGIIQHEQDEVFHRAYIYWTPTERISLNAELQFEEYDRKFIEDIDGPDELQTYVAPIGVSYFHPSGFFAKLSGTYVDQEVEFDEHDTETSRAEDHFEDNFWVIDASLGYRLPKRYGIVSINFANLLDEEFRYQSSFNLTEPRTPRFEPERAIFARINLWYY